MTNPIAMSERAHFARFAGRTGMLIGRTSLSGVTGFLAGYDQAARRHGGAGLEGCRQWLMAYHSVGGNLIREARIRQIALPGREGGPELTQEQEEQVLRVLFELLDAFLAEREGAVSGF
ncbi:hypothetical protein ABZ876_31195 [Streptomyces sp. NPDC046931]|uniref:hypothetical protein n=1 Tax=Streptomyces sp. NPDC046931 TaxID=3154806 RepID=UPI0033F732A8